MIRRASWREVRLNRTAAAAGIYIFAVSVVGSALGVHYTRLDQGLGSTLLPILEWQFLRYGSWLPVAYWLWKFFDRAGLSRRTLGATGAAGFAVVPVQSLIASSLAVFYSPYLAGVDLVRQALHAAPVNLLFYCAISTLCMFGAMRKRAIAAEDLNKRLAAALDAARESVRAEQHLAEKPELLMVSIGRNRIPVAVVDVEWFSSAGNYVVVNWQLREGLMRESLSSLEKRLPSAIFARVHRTTIVNLSCVVETSSLADGSWRLRLQSGMEVVASRSYRDQVLQRLGKRSSSNQHIGEADLNQPATPR
jgi:hypothetical protein